MFSLLKTFSGVLSILARPVTGLYQIPYKEPHLTLRKSKGLDADSFCAVGSTGLAPSEYPFLKGDCWLPPTIAVDTRRGSVDNRLGSLSESVIWARRRQPSSSVQCERAKA